MSSRSAPLRPPATSLLGRRAFLSTLLGSAAAVGLSACGDSAGAGPTLAAAAPLPTGVARSTALTIAVHTSHKQLEAAKLLDRLPFTVKDWPNIVAGPDVIQGFRARSIDLAANAGIPPIQAEAISFPARIVAVQTRTAPIYTFGTAPGSAITTLADLKGKKIAFSQGQAQGVVVLRTLKELGLSTKDVELVALPSTKFLVALQSRQVDAAPLGEPNTTKYLSQYGRDGAKRIEMTAVDYLTVLWAPVEVLEDSAKAAAIAAYIPYWAQGVVWAWENPAAWIDHYYVKDQGVTAADGRRIVDSTPKPTFPANWDKAITWEQESADLLTDGGFVPRIKAADLFDRRFEKLAADAVPASYRE